MATMKVHRFPVEVRWIEGKLTLASIEGKVPLPVATPPEFQGGIEGVWSPEDLFVASVASCFTVTLVSKAAARNVPLRNVVVRGVGDVSGRPDGQYGFVAVSIDAEVETAAGCEIGARLAVRDAEEACLVAASIDTPIEVTAQVTAATVAA